MILHKLLMVTAALLSISGCATTALQKQQQLANAPLVMTGLINTELALNLSATDVQKIQQLISASPAEAAQIWKNPQTHDAVAFTSLAITLNTQGQPCRIYKINITHHGKLQSFQTTACRRNNGTWYAVVPVPKMDATP